jgi:Putative prokaryotic signal transducing protein
MRQVLRTSSVSFAESLRVALEAEDIPAVITNENSAGIMPTAVTVAVTDDADYERALGVLRSVEVTAPPFWLSNRRILRLLVAAIVAIAILVCLNL